MKLPYLEMLHAKAEFSSSNSMPVREILGCARLDYKQIRNIRKINDQNIGRLNIMKVPYLEMLHAKVEISSSNSMPVREILGYVRLEYKQIRKIRKTRKLDHQKTIDYETRLSRDATQRI